MKKSKVELRILNQISILFQVAVLFCCSKPPVRDIEAKIINVEPEKAYTLIQSNKNNPDFVIVDVRTPSEYEVGHISGALNINYASHTFREEVKKLHRKRIYLLYCRSGRRSGEASKIFQEENFSTIYNLFGGIIEWTKSGYPLEK